jgi:hypothetical protein
MTIDDFLRSLTKDPSCHIADLHQLLTEMLPRRWRSATLDVERSADNVVRLTNLRAEVNQGGGQPAPFLGRDQAATITRMNDVLCALASALDDAWQGKAAVLTRAPEGSAQLALLGPGGAAQSHFDLSADAVAALPFSDELFDRLDGTRARAHEVQAAFQAHIQGLQRWDYVQDEAALSFVLANGTRWTVRGQLLGSWSRQDESWRWGWANESVPAAASAGAAEVRDGARAGRNLAALTTPSFACAQPFAVELALHAATTLGARGVFPGDYGAGVAFIAALG